MGLNLAKAVQVTNIFYYQVCKPEESLSAIPHYTSSYEVSPKYSPAFKIQQ